MFRAAPLTSMLAFAIFLNVASVPAFAQDFSMMADWAQQQMINDNLQRNLKNGNGNTGTGKPPVYAVGPGIRTPKQVDPSHLRQPHSGGAVPGATTTYQASPAVAARVRNQFVDFVRKTSGTQAATAIDTELKRKDYLRLWAEHAAQDGLHPGDVADAMAAYWVENWQMANKIDYAPPKRVRAVRQQVSSTILRNPTFARLNDAQKQEMAEIFIYNQILQDANYDGARNRHDAVTVQRISDASVTRFRNEMHVDLRQLALTDNGFTVRN